MSRTHPDEGERRQLQFGCRTCGEPAGSWCTGKHQAPVSYLHADRWSQATDAGLLPLEGGL